VKPSLLVVAGEASGDHHGALLVSELRRLCPDLDCYAAGGAELARTGARIVVPMDRLNVMGFFEVAGRISGVISSYRTLLDTVRKNGIRTAVLIDFPDFNLILARALKRMGVRIFYYVSPQLWAWRKGRINTIRRLVDHMFVIFPFEADFYREHGVPVTYAGHPLLDSSFPGPGEKILLRKEFSLEAAVPVLALAPGSRKGVVARLYPRMLEAFLLLRKTFPELRAIVGESPSVEGPLYQLIESRAQLPPSSLLRVKGRFRDIMHAADLALVASGTATLETGLVGTPMIIVYAMNRGTYRIARLLVKVPAIGMVNLVSGRPVVPELIQEQATPGRMAEEARRILSDPNRQDEIRKDLGGLREILGSRGASTRIARQILEMAHFDCGPQAPTVP